jgi:hypothetical protein
LLRRATDSASLRSPFSIEIAGWIWEGSRIRG